MDRVARRGAVVVSCVALASGCGPALGGQDGLPGNGSVAEPPARTADAVEAFARSQLEAVREEVGVAPRRIVLLGTFHFKDAGLDAYKPTHEFDALSERRQGEIAEVLDLLDAFDADVVCVEVKPSGQARMDERYAAYRTGTYELGPNEIYQLGFRLAAREALEGVAAVDAPARGFESRADVQAWAQENGQRARLQNPYGRAAFAFARREDRQVDAWHLRDTLLLANSDAMLDISHGMYLTGSFAVGDGEAYPGVDGFVSAWHNRNLRIFQNIINATEPGDDVVVVMGAGHVPLIKHMAECSPDFEVVEVAEVLGE
ncbi:MAG: DUF5694 domain-containing protein [Planctomycetota bacterium]